jgi:hypothetical protein
MTTRTMTPVVVVPGVFVYGPKTPKTRFAVIPDPSISSCTWRGVKPDTTVLATHEMVEAITDPDSAIIELAPVTGANLQCNGNFYQFGAIPVPPLATPPTLLVINGKSPYSWTDNTFNFCDPQEIADTCNETEQFSTTLKPDDNYYVSGIRLNSTHTCGVSPVQGTVTDPPTPPPESAHQRCLDACSAALERCMAGAHTGPERGECGREGQSCRQGCPP